MTHCERAARALLFNMKTGDSFHRRCVKAHVRPAIVLTKVVTNAVTNAVTNVVTTVSSHATTAPSDTG